MLTVPRTAWRPSGLSPQVVHHGAIPLGDGLLTVVAAMAHDNPARYQHFAKASFTAREHECLKAVRWWHAKQGGEPRVQHQRIGARAGEPAPDGLTGSVCTGCQRGVEQARGRR